MIKNVINFLAFQLGWFSCVLGAANGLPWIGPLVVLLAVLLHLVLVDQPARELRLVLVAMLMGLLFDSFLVLNGWLTYPNGMLVPGTAPYWIVAMWGLFATTINLSMNWLRGRYALAALLGAIFGPLSYIAGWRLGGLEFIHFNAAMIGLALAWAAAMPMLIAVAARIEGLANRNPAVAGEPMVVKS